MVPNALFAFLHFVAVFGVVATLFFEWFTFSEAPTLAEARRLQAADRWYGLFAMLLLVVGFIRVFYFEKGSAYYFHNGFFHAKLTLFVLVGLLSIYPTIRFIKWAPDVKQGRAPVVPAEQFKTIRNLLRAEMLLLLGIALCASPMARGIGM